MKSTYVVVVAFLCCTLIPIYAGVADYVVYDERNRDQLETLDGIVAVKIRAYYAFADLGLVKTVIEERKKAKLRPTGVECRRTSVRTRYGKETIYDSGSGKNEVLQMLRNSLWLLDAEITECFSGSYETNFVFIAVKPTRAYKYEELPHEFLKTPPDTDVIFGLVRLDDEEFKKSFRGFQCYLKNNLEFLDRHFNDGHLDARISGHNDYMEIFKTLTPSPCYVAREIGVGPGYMMGDSGVEEYGKESRLMTVFKEKVNDVEKSTSPIK